MFHANSDLTVHRKDLVRPELDKSYQQLLANSDNVVSTKFLFGDNLDQKIRTLTDVAKTGQKVGIRGYQIDPGSLMIVLGSLQTSIYFVQGSGSVF